MPVTIFRNHVVLPASSLSPSVSYPLSLKYFAMRSSAGLSTSTIRREGALSLPSPKAVLAQSMNACGTRIVFSRFEKPTIRPFMRSVRPCPLRRMSSVIMPITPSDSCGRLRLCAKPKLYRFR